MVSVEIRLNCRLPLVHLYDRIKFCVLGGISARLAFFTHFFGLTSSAVEFFANFFECIKA